MNTTSTAEIDIQLQKFSEGDEFLPGGEPREFVRRDFDVELETAPGRTLIGRCVPYNEPTLVMDPWSTEPYREEWLPGVFDRNLKAANRVLLDFEHQSEMGKGLHNVIGRGIALRSEGDGLYADFKVYENQDGDRALELYNDGVLTGLSIWAKLIKNQRSPSGIVQRVQAHLSSVALCRHGAFENAKVLAARTLQEVEELAAVAPFNEELAARLAAAGLDVPTELTPEIARAFTEQVWDGSPSRFADTAAYCRSCLIDDNPPGKDKIQALCHLPIREPNGDVNVNAVRNALARVGQVQSTAAKKARARATLERMLATFNNQGGGGGG